MFALYDVLNHRWRVIWWSADKVRRDRINHQFMIAELSSELAEAVRNHDVPKHIVYEGIARYAAR